MFVDWNYYKNESLGQIEDSLKKVLSAYQRHHGKSLYVGITGNLEQRCSQHHTNWGNQWEKMIVIYQTPFPGEAMKAENQLIEYGKKEGIKVELENIQGARDLSSGLYVYVLIDKKANSHDGPKEPINDEIWRTWMKDYKKTGLPNSVIGTLNHRIGQYARHSDYIYIGMTNNPKRRWGEHQRKWAPRDKWDEMRLVYETTSLGNVMKVEDALIKNVKSASYRYEKVLNIKGGNGIPPDWYVYVLIPN